jgi:hypothetical protein
MYSISHELCTHQVRQWFLFDLCFFLLNSAFVSGLFVKFACHRLFTDTFVYTNMWMASVLQDKMRSL